MNKKPPELHLIDGTKPRTTAPVNLPESIKKRIPKAEWLDNPDSWNRDVFLQETADFLWEVYGIGNDQDKHALAMLADNIETYIKCVRGIRKNGIVTTFNNGQTVGPNPYISIKQKTLTQIIQLMNELGLTPRGRLSAGKQEADSPIAKLLRGPKG
jgi:P27 family predicted phage terminase small subunit